MKNRKKKYSIRNDRARGRAGAAARRRYTDLDFFFGSWIPDMAVEEALADQRRVDKALWK